MRTTLAAVFAALLCLWLVGTLQAQDKTKGAQSMDMKALYVSRGCAHCHGEDGRTPMWDTFPIIAGQKAGYIYLVLKGYKTGERKGLAASQHDEVNDLMSDAEMHAFADYVSKMK